MQLIFYTLLNNFELEDVSHAGTTDGEADGFFVLAGEGGGIGDYTGEVAATTGSGHLPGQHLIFILLNVGRDTSLHHSREHGGLGVEAGFVGGSKCL